MPDHDPFNNPETAHPRARELMTEPFFWDCVDEWAPFGSDEGHEAYHEWRRWRAENPGQSLTACLSWILDGKLADYNESLCSSDQVLADLQNPCSAFLAEHYDMFTLDTTIIATGLGQLIDEGIIDAGAGPVIEVALKRQLHPSIGGTGERGEMLLAIQRVVRVACTA